MSQQVLVPPVGSDADVTDVSPTPSRGTSSRQVRLAALPSAVPWARRILRHVLRERQLERMSDPALLLVSELVTNAVQASGNVGCPDHRDVPMIAVALELTDTSLLIKVWDASSALPVLREADVDGDCGRGLLLVDFLADGWGHRAAGEGKVIWCEVAIPG